MHAIGIDIGGTKIAGGLVAEDGTIVRQERRPTPAGDGESIIRAVVEVAAGGRSVAVRRTGSFGRVRAEDATSLAMVVSELVQNAAEHGVASQGGTINLEVKRKEGKDETDVLTVTVTDDGVGLPGGRLPAGAGLGTQIVQSLVQDLRGKISWGPAEPQGTRVRFTARLR